MKHCALKRHQAETAAALDALLPAVQELARSGQASDAMMLPQPWVMENIYILD
ncbi:MAG TPA: hypothetical protein PKK68_12505 [Methanothrix soehngenii]|jgi:hypothetical protein|nr:hypothetical protein [Methanothrix soehngenii]